VIKGEETLSVQVTLVNWLKWLHKFSK